MIFVHIQKNHIYSLIYKANYQKYGNSYIKSLSKFIELKMFVFLFL